jgi:hypothetical protein
MDCFAELVIGRRLAPTRWLAMTNPKSIDLPDGQITSFACPLFVQSLRKKYSA